MNHKITLEYNADDGYLFPDGQAEKWVDGLLLQFEHDCASREEQGWDDAHYKFKVCSALLIDIFRLRLAEGRLKPGQLEIYFNGKKLDLNEYGRIAVWPKGFCDRTDKILTKLLEIQHKSWKKRT